MKKESLMIKVLKKSTIGFFIGITLLIVAYVGVYFILGEATFVKEMSQLQNIKTLIVQVVLTGIIYYMMLVCFKAFACIENKEMKDKYMLKHPYTYLFIPLIITIIVFLLAIYILSNSNIYSENIATLNLIILIICFALSALIFCIKSFRESQVIKKINQKLKERNS